MMMLAVVAALIAVANWAGFRFLREARAATREAE